MLIKVSNDGTVQGNYWEALERFERLRAAESAAIAERRRETRIQEMLAKLDALPKRYTPRPRLRRRSGAGRILRRLAAVLDNQSAGEAS